MEHGKSVWLCTELVRGCTLYVVGRNSILLLLNFGPAFGPAWDSIKQVPENMLAFVPIFASAAFENDRPLQQTYV